MHLINRILRVITSNLYVTHMSRSNGPSIDGDPATVQVSELHINKNEKHADV